MRARKREHARGGAPGHARPDLVQGPGAESLRADDLRAADDQLGRTPKERLAWAIDFVQKDLRALTPGDWLNLRSHLSAFAWTDVLSSVSPLLRSHRGLMVERLRYALASEEEARQAHETFRQILDRVIRQTRVDLGHYRVQLVLSRRETASGWVMDPHISSVHPVKQAASTLTTVADFTEAPVTRATFVLAHLLGPYAHLVKACPAPASRRAGGGRCGRWFLAKRPNQNYCSHQCQARAATRAHRGRVAGRKPPARVTRSRPSRRSALQRP